MYSVIIPVGLLFILIMVKKIPYVGGKVPYALIIAAVVTLICGHIYNPIDWAKAWISGLDRLSWVMALALVGRLLRRNPRCYRNSGHGRGPVPLPLRQILPRNDMCCNNSHCCRW